MKNIHVLPTENSSRLSYNKDGVLELNRLQWRKNTQNIYITNDEEIKEGVNQWYLDKYLNKPYNSGGAQYSPKQDVIILTTDQDLIKDGVQAIDDEFLEWFVKNPSCEFVEVDLIPYDGTKSISKYWNGEYKIIIPKEEPKQEPKQETLEEVVNKLSIKEAKDLDLFLKGAKWQQEQDKKMYSEEDVRGMLEDMSRYVSTKEMRDNVVDVGYSEWVRKRDWFVNHLIKQFKNK